MVRELILGKLVVLGTMLVMALGIAVPAGAQDASAGQYARDEATIRGTITEISGSADEPVALVEEDPSDKGDPMGPPESTPSSPKGYFSVTGETEILDQRGGGQVPATVEDLRVGQLVEATYVGPVAASYPQQGTAGSIVILADAPDPSGPDPTAPGTGGSGGASGGMSVLPDTGGPSPVLLVAGVLAVVASGLLASAGSSRGGRRP